MAFGTSRLELALPAIEREHSPSPPLPGRYPSTPPNERSASPDRVTKQSFEPEAAFHHSKAKSRHDFYESRLKMIMTESAKPEYSDPKTLYKIARSSVPDIAEFGFNMIADSAYRYLMVESGSNESSELLRGLERQSRDKLTFDSIKGLIQKIGTRASAVTVEDELVRLKSAYAVMKSDIAPYADNHKNDIKAAIEKWDREIAAITVPGDVGKAKTLVSEALWLAGLPQNAKDWLFEFDGGWLKGVATVAA